ncbi:SMP-30/gluconolactonase/LRE family protein [Paraconexibacter algicola]|uniref:SMP-30/Gluconolactonase/LRE-like region domain-containing protein n=1 Tax=Paraconexibacter algicola TaxID=2133960 RepID=A0A2T4ULQ7_9ACTN|nr:SMP-30/gluconolactonase/LRE family protein [Paraconexibacter algicola]PTL60170.1 hypothetical protein C7Y72_11225 [Paraconexibacter algicola]
MSDPFGLEPLASGGYGLTEAPRIGRDGTVWFSDVTGGGVHRIAPGGEEVEVVLERRRGIGGLVLHRDGIVVSGRDLLQIRADGSQHVLFAPDEELGITGFNDLHVDRNGWLLAGALRFRPMAGEEPQAGRLVVIGPRFVAAAVEDGLTWPNGIGLAPDGRTAYVCDHQHHRVLATAVDRDGALHHEVRTFAQAPEGHGVDGLAVDAEGGIWVATAHGGGLVRFAPDGTVDRVVEGLAPFVASLAFGGPDGRDVVVCAVRGEEGGAVLRGRSDVPGLPTPPCLV